MSNEEKLESGKYIAVPKIRGYIQTITSIVAILGLVVVGVRNADLTFDNQSQKYEVLDLLNDHHPITEGEAVQVKIHPHNSNVHMTFKEKATNIRIEENQKKLGEDLAEIKTQMRTVIRKLNQ